MPDDRRLEGSEGEGRQDADEGARRNDGQGTVSLGSEASYDSAADRDRDELPLADWGRYRVESLLGRGGMGAVYKAWDPNLKRHVALKLLRVDRGSERQRFVREAQAQAGIDHPHVCKVFDAGELGDRAFIAMQMVDGRPLDQVAGECGVEQLVAIIAKVSRALHAAHKMGLIHRDLKPANIMMERSAEGGWWPYLVDFGLAREVGTAGVTVTGAALGTPAFMAPEQVDARSEQLDRRVDVYGLGATLYTLLAGKPPFSGSTSVEVLVKLIGEDPEGLRKIVPSLPRDLETVVMKCLEKDPGRRYESARALAEDLERYLDGEPVAARPASLLYRLGKRLRKNRRLAVAAGLALVALATVAGLWIRDRVVAARQVELVRRFDAEAQEVEHRLRLAKLAPEHDIAAEKQALRERMERLEDEIASLGSVAEGPGRLALGRAHLALSDVDAAREELERAWQGGYRVPDVASSLGIALVRVYQDRLQRARMLPDSEERAIRVAELDRKLKEPARELLRRSQEAAGAPEAYVEGLIAYLESRHEDALAHLQEARQGRPWDQAPVVTEGEVLAVRASERMQRGEIERAVSDFDSAEAVLLEAVEIARSDPEAWSKLCSTRTQRAELWVRFRGQDPTPLLDDAEDACLRVSKVDGEQTLGFTQAAYAWRLLAQYKVDRGEDATAAADRSQALVERAVARDPGDAWALYHLAEVHSQRGTDAIEREADPTAHLSRAIEGFERCLEVDPNHGVALMALGNAHRGLGTHAITAGGDPDPHLDRAIEVFERCIELEIELPLAYSNLGTAFTERVRHRGARGEDPAEWVGRAREAYRLALELNPQLPNPWINLGITLVNQGRFLFGLGSDPREVLREAVAALERGLELKPSQTVAHRSACDGYEFMGRYETGHGLDPRPSYRAGLEHIRAVSEADPERLGARSIEGMLHCEIGKWEAANGIDPTASFAAARRGYLAELELRPREVLTINNLGDLEIFVARTVFEAGGDPSPHLEFAVEWLERAHELSPQWSFPVLNLVFVHRTAADFALVQGRDPRPAVSSCMREFERGVALQPGIAEVYYEAAAARLAEAEYLDRTGGNPGKALAAARPLLAETTRLNPQLPGLEELLQRAADLEGL